MTVRRILVVPVSIAAIAVTMAFGVPPAGAASSKTYVTPTGTDSGTCTKRATCLTITYALTQTRPGGTVEVGSGTYDENLVIAQDVTIRGSGVGETVIQPTTLAPAGTDTDSPTPQNSIVDVRPGAQASLESLTVDGSKASPLFSAFGCANDFVGVNYRDAEGTLKDVAVTNVELPQNLFGCQDGLGIYVTTDLGSSTPSSVSMLDVSVTTYQKNGITCDDPATFCSISHSYVSGIGPTPLIAQNGIQLWGASGVITDNTVVNNSYTDPNYVPNDPSSFTSAAGLLAFNGRDLTMTGNDISFNDDDAYVVQAADFGEPDGGAIPTPDPWQITSNAFSDAYDHLSFGLGLGDGLDIDSTSSELSVHNNAAANDPEYGLALLAVTNADLRSNESSNDGYGIYVGGPGNGGSSSTNNAFNSNEADSNSQVGIYVDTETSDNTFTKNVAQSNTTVDVNDASTGSGTSGTANTWDKTVCSTSTPSGICASNRHGPLPPFHHFYGPRPRFFH
ncbi:MAG: NosD domain-containing protein [Acidimicrobiales bacterium]